MLASELVQLLQNMITKHGDHRVCDVNHDYDCNGDFTSIKFEKEKTIFSSFRRTNRYNRFRHIE
jgi:hypothetical protein